MTTQTQNPAETKDPAEPTAVRIVRGEPSAEELAALVAVLAARSAASAGNGAAAPSAAVSGWTDRARHVRSARIDFGARAGWRASALPR